MAGFFSLGSAANPQQQQQDLNTPQTLIPPEKWFQLRNEDLAAAATTTAFELWHHQQAADHERINSSSNLYNNRLGFGVGVGVGHTETEANNHRLSDDQTTPLPMMMMMMQHQQGGGSSDGRRGSISCQDCGNQAKKECVHMRCRTCCKSRGFECQTHVKSTWVPASKRRERHEQQLQLKRIRHDPNSTAAAAAAAASNSSLACGSSSRLAPSPSALAAGGGMEVERMPPEVRAAAVFKCVRVSPIDQGEEIRLEQLVAYQTSVTIGGHLFRGILYDQGPENYHQHQSHNATDVVGSHRIISNASNNTQHHASFAVDPRNLYQATNADPNIFPGGSVGAHFFP